ncbi:MAG: YHS domain-containing (seleno)protein [Cyclobacteriaceae bacterium]
MANTQKGYVAEGYDVVAYFKNEAIKGSKKLSYVYQKNTYLFVNESNLKAFKSSPTTYIPQYGGWCAYAMAKDGSKVSINPKTFEIRDGKLYLFYNKLITNTYNSWIKEGAEELVKQANQNWK